MYNCVNYLLTAPWPPFGPQKPDPLSIHRLYALYAGSKSEMTAVTAYLYNSLLLSQSKDADLSELFSCVARTEMYHMETLGKLLLAYGADPKYVSFINGRQQWWNGGMPTYRKEPEAILRTAIRAEQDAVQDYTQAASRIAPEPKAVLERIILDEKHHLELFEAALAALSTPPTPYRPHR